jgi:hypothetical protein
VVTVAFDDALIEFTDPNVLPGWLVQVYKVGGGTIGHPYEGYWGYCVAAQGDGAVAAQGEDLYTGTPKTHAQAAVLASEFMLDRGLQLRPLPTPDWEDDGRAGWFPRGPFDVEADPTGRDAEQNGVLVRTGGPSSGWRMSRDAALALATALQAAAAYR